jgi:hypothetical protein
MQLYGTCPTSCIIRKKEDLFTIRPDLAARLFYETMPSEALKGKGSRDDK